MIKKKILTLLVGFMFATTYIDVYADSNYKKTLINGDNKQISMELNKSYFKKADEAIIINENAGVDAISATPLAYLKDAPIIAVDGKKISNDILNYIKELEVKGVTIIGGVKNVSKSAEKQLHDMGININRIHGENRYETSQSIAEEMGKEKDISNVVVISNTAGLENAIAISNFACKKNAPIIWADDNSFRDTSDFVEEQEYDNVYAVGNSARFTYASKNEMNNVKIIKEMSRYETNIDTIKENNKNLDTIYTVNIDYGNRADISKYVSLPVVAAKEDIPILVCNDNFTYPQEEFIKKNVDKVIEVGEAVEPYSIIDTLKNKSFIRVYIIILAMIAILIRGVKA